MKWISKNIWWILCTLALGTVLLLCLSKPEEPTLQFSVADTTGNRNITIHHTEGNSYVFLPSYARMEQVYVVLPEGKTATINGRAVHNGMDCSWLELDQENTLVDCDGKTRKLVFCRSADIPAMYIDTISGNMKHIHADEYNQETVSVALVTSDGVKTYGTDRGTLSGRGNTSWTQEKKPYALKLENEADLLGMGSAAGWILLANGGDETNLRNKVALDLARKAGMKGTPDCRYIDLYLNGEYNGLYLLMEKVEIGDNRLNIDESAGDFIGKIELNQRWDTLDAPFLTANNRAVEIVAPNVLVNRSRDDVVRLVNQMESVLLSDQDLTRAENIDLDSWVRRYLVDEICGNLDADIASSYFYYTQGRFYAGPVWDYDLAFFSPKQGQILIAKQQNKSAIEKRLYYGALFRNESFYNRAVELYEAEFLPILEQMIEQELQENATLIRSAMRMNGLRWNMLQNAEQGKQEIASFLKDRIAFLSEMWIEGKVYHSLQFETEIGKSYWTITVEHGKCLETDMIDLETTQWTIAGTTQKFDPSQPITEDMILVQPTVQLAQSPPVSLAEKVVAMGIAVILGAIVILAVVDFRRSRERGKANGS